MLIENYYTILNSEIATDSASYEVALNSDCKVYEGHFPQKAVCPGVCNINMIKELAEKTIGKPLKLSAIQQCRLTTLLTPDEYPSVCVKLSFTSEVEHEYKLLATIGNNEDIYLSLKANLSE